MPKCSSKSILFDMDPVTQSCHRRNHDDGKADPVTCVQPDGNNHKQRWSTEKDPLTDRERLILRRAGDGETTAELARSLRLTEGTVRNYLSEAISKLHASNRTEAARIARDKGWL